MEVYHAEMKIHRCIGILLNQKGLPINTDMFLKLGQIKIRQIENLEKIFLLIDLPLGGKNNLIIDPLVEKCINFIPRLSQNKESLYQVSQIMLSINAIIHSSYTWMAFKAIHSNLEELESLLSANLDMETEIGDNLMQWSIRFDNRNERIQKII